MGRQAVNFSKAYFWNPLDVFLPFDPRAFDREYKPGVDAARASVAFAATAGLDVVYAPGRTVELDVLSQEVRAGEGAWDATWYGSALLGRIYATAGPFDLAVQGGKVYGGAQVGGGFAGEVLTVGVRGEIAYLFAAEEAEGAEPVTVIGPDGDVYDVTLVPDHLDVVAGLDRRFGEEVYVALEYAYNGAGDPDPVAAGLRLMAGEVQNLSRHLLGALVQWSPIPVLDLKLAGMFSLSDGSVLLTPTVGYSISDEADFTAGVMIPLGKRPEEGLLYPRPASEFGTYPHAFFGQVRFYF